MIKVFAHALLIILASVFIAYCIFVFVLYEPNINNWRVDDRALLVFMSCMVSVVLFAVKDLLWK